MKDLNELGLILFALIAGLGVIVGIMDLMGSGK